MILINLLRGKRPAVCDCCLSNRFGPLTYVEPRRLSRKELLRHLDPEDSPKRIALHDPGGWLCGECSK